MSNKIVVWHMNGVMDAGGTESLIMNMFRYNTQRVEYALVVHEAERRKKGIYDEEIQEIGIPIYYLPAVGKVGIKQYIEAFADLIKEKGSPNIIHSHLNGVGGVIAKAAEKAGVKNRIIHCHADIAFRGTKLQILRNEIKLAGMKILVNRYGNHFFACSRKAAQRLFYKSEKAIVINNAICVEKYLCDDEKYIFERRKHGFDSKTIIIGAVGRIARIKNYEVVLKAVSKLKQLGENVKFVCYGRVAEEKYYTELLTLCQTENIQEDVLFMGNSEEVFNDIAMFDLFVMPSLKEGFGMALLEAQAAGKKCLVSTGVPLEADIGLGMVEYISPNNVDEWVEKVLQIEKVMVSNDILHNKLKERGFDAISEVKKIEDIYLKIANRM